jgi:hypothetical protein
MGWKDAPEIEPTGKKPKWAEAPLEEGPLYAPNGVPMNAAAKAEIQAKAKRTVKGGGSEWSGIDPKRAGEVARFNAMGEAAMNASPTDQGAVGAFLGSLAPGLAFGGADEIAAGIGSVFEDRPYEAILAGLRNQDRQNEEQHPYASTAGKIAGAVAPGALASKVVAAARTLPGMVGSGIGWGAAGGATQGFLEGEGGLENRLSRAGAGMVLGGALGGAIPLVGAGIKQAWRAGADALRNNRVGSEVGKSLGVSNVTGRVLADMIGSEDEAAMRAALARGGPNAMLADVSPQATGALDMAMRSPIPAARDAAAAVEGRAAAAYDDVTRALDEAMGKPSGLQGAQAAVRDGTAGARKEAYDAAFNVDIDWRSPEGEQLRALIESTPDDVLKLAAKNRAMKARAPVIPDSAYADEFADTVTSRPGPFAGDYAGRQSVDTFFDEYTAVGGEKLYKRPIAHTIKKMGGIDPTGAAAAELRQLGITPKTAPGLFRYGGLKDVDNLDLTRFPDTLKGDGTGYYASRQGILDALASEAAGSPVRSTQDAITERMLADFDRMLPEMEAKRKALNAADRAMAAGPTAPPVVGDIVPTQTVYDIDQIKRALDEIRRTNDGKGLMGGQTEYGVEAGKRAKEMRDLLAQISPDYKTALATSADTISRVEAIKTGALIMSPTTTREAVADAIKDATGGELAAMKIGLRSQIDEVLANVRAVASDQNIDARAVGKAFSDFSSPAAREKMALVLGNDWPALKAELDKAGVALGLRARTSANSATFGRGAAEAKIMEEVTPGALRRGEPVQAAKNLIASALGASPDAVRRLRDDVKGEIASVLTRQGNAGQSIDAILAALAGNPINPAAGSRVRKIAETLLLGNVGNVSSGWQELLRQ